jgi:hypothetical protein
VKKRDYPDYGGANELLGSTELHRSFSELDDHAAATIRNWPLSIPFNNAFAATTVNGTI